MDLNIINALDDIDKREDLSDDEKVKRISHYAAGACAVIAIQPIPIADIFFLTPTQALFASRIARIRGVPISQSSATEVMKELVGIVGLGILAQQTALAIWKFVTIGLGAMLSVPMVYAFSYGIMQVADAYFVAKAEGRELSKREAKSILKAGQKEAKQAAQDFDPKSIQKPASEARGSK